MPQRTKYLVDTNLPYYFSLWKGDEFEHVNDINPSMSDTEIRVYAQERGLTIITKDADFSERILLHTPPPKVIHIRLGNMTIKTLYRTLEGIWKEILNLSDTHKLVNVYQDRIEGIG